MDSASAINAPNRRDNSLNFIRILAAINVFYGHCTTHLGIATDPIIDKVISLFQGVPIFFILSGFLLWGSITRTPSFKVFASKRLLRLYPELWCAVLINALVMLVLYSDGIIPIPFLLFIFTQSTVLQFWTPSSLRGYGVGTPNGSLWTISPMVQCYLVIWILFRFLRKKKIIVWIIALTLGIACNAIFPLLEPLYPNEIIYKLSMQTFFPYLWLFLAGAFICEYFEKCIIILMRYWYLFFAASAIIRFTGIDISGAYGTLECLFLAPAIIGFGYRVNRIHIPHDFSYGFYLFHVVIINAMVQLGFMHNPGYFFIAFAISVLVSIVSYFTVGAISRRRNEKVKNIARTTSD